MNGCLQFRSTLIDAGIYTLPPMVSINVIVTLLEESKKSFLFKTFRKFIYDVVV